MAASAPVPGRPVPPRYFAHAEAANLFRFLTGTFFQMPKSIQITG